MSNSPNQVYSQRTIRRLWLFAIAIAVLATRGFGADDTSATAVSSENSEANAWTVSIRPRTTVRSRPVIQQAVYRTQVSKDSGQQISDENYQGPYITPRVTVGGANLAYCSYGEIYRSIPFLRPEFDFNPTYRHQAAMQILASCCCRNGEPCHSAYSTTSDNFGEVAPPALTDDAPSP